MKTLKNVHQLLSKKFKRHIFWGEASNNFKKYQSNQEALKEVIRTSVVYPRTTSLFKDKPRTVFSERIGSPKLQQFIERNQTLVAYSIMEDVKEVVQLLWEHKADILAEEVDFIQIYKGGIDVLRIYRSPELEASITKLMEKNENERENDPSMKNLDRSIYIEINFYRSKMFQEAAMRQKRTRELFFTIFLSIAGITMTISTLLNWRNLYYNKSK